jgi:hypothetical protein
MDEQNKKNRKYSEIFNIISKNIYLILSIMVFLGFFQTFIYYQNFDIGVYNYSSPIELLFYFIPNYIITPIKISFKIFSNPYFQIFIFLLICLFSIKNSLIEKILKYLKNIWSKPNKFICFLICLYIIFVSYFIIELIYGLLSLEGLSDFTFYISNSFVNSKGNYNWLFQILYLLWGILIIVGVYSYIIRKENIRKFGNKVSIIVISILVVMFIFESLKTTHKVASLKRYISIQKVKFQYDNVEVETNDSEFYIGSTRDYLFIRNLNSNENKLYNVSNIKFLKTRLY